MEGCSGYDRESESTEAATLGQISDIESIVELPFPSLLAVPRSFQLNEDGFFKYQGRSDLKSLHDKIVNFWKNDHCVKVDIVGTIGYGKSHMLAVLVLLLLLKPIYTKYGSTPFVCYIPDFQRILFGEAAVVAILRRNIQLNMSDFSGQIHTIEDIRAVMRYHKVILVADQWNSIDGPNTECIKTWERLRSCFGTSVCVEIHGMSTNSNPHAVLPKHISQDRIIYNGGFNDDEFRVWLQHHRGIFTEHKDELALLTGKVPLLLSAFRRVYKEGDSWESVVQRVQQDAISVKNWLKLLMIFYANIDANQV
ncbi:unnamed protein product [Phytophthora fragariaefolia]|uniref:Unnamed protein product n=1 Tax=Phytophthora fragariaefolia TaxID=1490495 RepID=A0A9W6YMW2_9STRA|nr:unnamed protein product [Phytophthora fragariaefolia]